MDPVSEEHEEVDDTDVEPAIMLVSMLGNEHEAYWGRRYQKELQTLKLDISSGQEDPMERLFIWFGRLPLLLTAQMIYKELGLTPTSSILDLGCGNGFMCEVLHALGFQNVTGSDYCPFAIVLCQTVCNHFRRQKSEQKEWGTSYICDDVLRTRMPRGAFDLIHDCGTLDSIAMTLPGPEHTPAGAGAAEPDARPRQAGGGGSGDHGGAAAPAAAATMVSSAGRTAGSNSEAEAAGPAAADEDCGGGGGCGGGSGGSGATDVEGVGGGNDAAAEAAAAATAVALAAAAAAAVERGSEPELWQGAGAAGYFRNAAALLRRPGGRLVIRSCGHSVPEMVRIAAGSCAPLVLERDASLPGTAVATAVFALAASAPPPPA